MVGERQSVSDLAMQFAPEPCGTPLPKTTPPPRPSSDAPAVEMPGASQSDTAQAVARMSEAISGNDSTAFTSDPGCRSAQPGLQKAQGSRTPTDAVLNRLPCGKRAPCAGRARLSAFHCGSCQGDSWSPRLCTRPRFPGSVRSARSYGPPTGAKIVRVSTGVTRAVLSPSSEHLTHRSLCRQSDARCRPSAEATKPLPAGTAIPLPPAIRHPADALARGARGRRF